MLWKQDVWTSYQWICANQLGTMKAEYQIWICNCWYGCIYITATPLNTIQSHRSTIENRRWAQRTSAQGSGWHSYVTGYLYLQGIYFHSDRGVDAILLPVVGECITQLMLITNKILSLTELNPNLHASLPVIEHSQTHWYMCLPTVSHYYYFIILTICLHLSATNEKQHQTPGFSSFSFTGHEWNMKTRKMYNAVHHHFHPFCISLPKCTIIH